MIEMLLKADDSADLRDAIFHGAFAHLGEKFSATPGYCGYSYQHFGVYASRRAYPELSMLPLFEQVAEYLGYSVEQLPDDARPYVIDARSGKTLERVNRSASHADLTP